jgi:Flp pilus assembly protein TadB
MNSNGAKKLADWLRALLGISLLPALVVFYLASSRAWLISSLAHIVFALAGVALLSILLSERKTQGDKRE